MKNTLVEMAGRVRDKQRLTAVGLGVSHRGSIPEVAVSGLRRHKGGKSVSETDKWHIGSVTKSITATLIALLVDEGDLKFEMPVSELLPGYPIHGAWKSCTLEQLLNHTAGLPGNFPLKGRNQRPNTLEELVSLRARLITAALSAPPKSNPGERFMYSNIGYVVAGHIAEKCREHPYETLLDDYVFQRFGLTSAGFGPPQGKSPDDQPMGHISILSYRKAANPLAGDIADNGPAISAAGRVHMNISDLISYGKLHLSGELGNSEHLTKETWQRLHQPALSNYALGWMNTDRDWASGPVIWHNGSNTLWYALLMLLPGKDAVFAFVTNNGAVRKAERAFMQAAEELASALPA